MGRVVGTETDMSELCYLQALLAATCLVRKSCAVVVNVEDVELALCGPLYLLLSQTCASVSRFEKLENARQTLRVIYSTFFLKLA